MATAADGNTNRENVEVKLDRAMLFVQGCKDLQTLQQIFNLLEISPGVGMDGNNRRDVVRALVGYLNDPAVIFIENIELNLDMINNLCQNFYAVEREKKREGRREQNVILQNILPDQRRRAVDNRVDDIPGIGPHNTGFTPTANLLGDGGEEEEKVFTNVGLGMANNIRPTPPPRPVHRVQQEGFGAGGPLDTGFVFPPVSDVAQDQNNLGLYDNLNYMFPAIDDIPEDVANDLPDPGNAGPLLGGAANQVLPVVAAPFPAANNARQFAANDIPPVIPAPVPHSPRLVQPRAPAPGFVAQSPAVQGFVPQFPAQGVVHHQAQGRVHVPAPVQGYGPVASPVPANAWAPAPVQPPAPVQAPGYVAARAPVYNPPVPVQPPAPVQAPGYLAARAPVYNPPVPVQPPAPVQPSAPVRAPVYVPAQAGGYNPPASVLAPRYAPAHAHIYNPPAPVQAPGYWQVPAPAPQVPAPVYNPPAPAAVYAPAPANVPVGVPNPVPFVHPGGNLVPGVPGPRPRIAAAAPAGYYGGGRLRECKINGKIVDAGEKDGITYGSLMFQIESAVRQGYPDVDICSAIIRATSSQSLRGVMEARPGATMADITPALKAHFTVKGVKSIFNELGREKQGKGENALQFCMRMIGLRHLVTRMNREENGEYTDQLIQSQFQSSLSTGLSGELRHVLRAMLRVPGVDDNVLMKEITDLMLSETEHQEKEGVAKTARVNAVVEGPTNQKKEQRNKNNPLLTEMSKISADVKNLSAMQQRMNELDKELKMQQRVFRMLTLSPDQRQLLASEHPEMLPPIDNSPAFNNFGTGQGYDPANAVYRSRGGYRGNAGSAGRGGYHRGGYRGGGGGNRGGSNGVRGGSINVASTPAAGQNNNLGNVNSNVNNNSNVSLNNNSNNSSNSNNPHSLNNINPVNNQSNLGYTTTRGNFGGQRGQQRGVNRGAPYTFAASYNVGCANCWRTNAPFCTHCFQCGESGHAAMTCPLNLN